MPCPNPYRARRGAPLTLGSVPSRTRREKKNELMKLTVTEPRSVEVIKAGTYKAVLTSITQEESKGPSAFENSNPYFLRWVFTIKGKAKSIDLWASSSTSFGPKSKAYGWACALLGRKLAAGEEVDTDQLVGCPCLVVVDVETDDRNFERNKVLEVTAIPGDNEPF